MLKQEYTVIIVTHNMQQAARVSDYTGFMYLGKLIECGKTVQIFEHPEEGTDRELYHRPVRVEKEMAEKFHTELKTLKKDTVAMALLGRSMLRDAVDALVRQDKELAASVVARKEEIHEMEVKLEEHCYQLIALYQPMAKDMRVIACTLKVITASLRIGRYGKVIAKIVSEVSDKPHIVHLMSIPHMAELVIDVIDDAIQSMTANPRSPSRISQPVTTPLTLSATRSSAKESPT